MTHSNAAVANDYDREFLRLPGLYRRWEFEQVVEAGREFHIEEAGQACDGTQLFAIYWRKHFNEEDNNE